MLGVSRDATPREIKAAYRNLAKKFHTDLLSNFSDEAQQQGRRIIQAINEAYEVLRDQSKRAQYDLTQPSAESNEMRPEQRPATDRTDPFSIFNDIFTGDGFGLGKSPSRQKAKSQVQEREQQIIELKNDISGARNIYEIIIALEQLQKLGYSLEFIDYQNYDSQKGYGKLKLSPQGLISLITKAVRNMGAESSQFSASIEALPEGMGIRNTVKSELESRKNAFDTLKKSNVDDWEIIQAMDRLQQMGSVIDVKINGQPEVVVLKEELDRIRKISRNKSDAGLVNKLIVQVTQWNDLDLKIYYAVRAASSHNWRNVPVPQSISARYERYERMRRSS